MTITQERPIGAEESTFDPDIEHWFCSECYPIHKKGYLPPLMLVAICGEHVPLETVVGPGDNARGPNDCKTCLEREHCQKGHRTT